MIATDIYRLLPEKLLASLRVLLLAIVPTTTLAEIVIDNRSGRIGGSATTFNGTPFTFAVYDGIATFTFVGDLVVPDGTRFLVEGERPGAFHALNNIVLGSGVSFDMSPRAGRTQAGGGAGGMPDGAETSGGVGGVGGAGATVGGLGGAGGASGAQATGTNSPNPPGFFTAPEPGQHGRDGQQGNPGTDGLAGADGHRGASGGPGAGNPLAEALGGEGGAGGRPGQGSIGGAAGLNRLGAGGGGRYLSSLGPTSPSGGEGGRGGGSGCPGGSICVAHGAFSDFFRLSEPDPDAHGEAGQAGGDGAGGSNAVMGPVLSAGQGGGAGGNGGGGGGAGGVVEAAAVPVVAAAPAAFHTVRLAFTRPFRAATVGKVVAAAPVAMAAAEGSAAKAAWAVKVATVVGPSNYPPWAVLPPAMRSFGPLDAPVIRASLVLPALQAPPAGRA